LYKAEVSGCLLWIFSVLTFFKGARVPASPPPNARFAPVSAVDGSLFTLPDIIQPLNALPAMLERRREGANSKSKCKQFSDSKK
jgi:hypothetical protein